MENSCPGTVGNCFTGVRLCSLHKAAPELLEVAKEYIETEQIAQRASMKANYSDLKEAANAHNALLKLQAIIARAEGGN